MKYLLRWFKVMYTRKIHRQSHEGRFMRKCDYLERKWERALLEKNGVK